MIWAIYLWNSELTNICETRVTHFLWVLTIFAPEEFFHLWVSTLCRRWTVTSCMVRYCAFLPKDYINPNATIVAYGKVFGGVIPIVAENICPVFTKCVLVSLYLDLLGCLISKYMILEYVYIQIIYNSGISAIVEGFLSEIFILNFNWV